MWFIFNISLRSFLLSSTKHALETGRRGRIPLVPLKMVKWRVAGRVKVMLSRYKSKWHLNTNTLLNLMKHAFCCHTFTLNKITRLKGITQNIHKILTIHHCLIFISIHSVQGDVISPWEEHVLLLWDPLDSHRGTSGTLESNAKMHKKCGGFWSYHQFTLSWNRKQTKNYNQYMVIIFLSVYWGFMSSSASYKTIISWMDTPLVWEDLFTCSDVENLSLSWHHWETNIALCIVNN